MTDHILTYTLSARLPSRSAALEKENALSGHLDAFQSLLEEGLPPECEVTCSVIIEEDEA